MVAVKGDVIVVRPRSKVSRRFSRGVSVVYKGLGGSVVEGCGFGGAAGSGCSDLGAFASLFDPESGSIIIYRWNCGLGEQ